MLFLNNAIFRGAGDAAIAMRLLWVSNIINLVLDPCLIFGLGPFPRMGVTGAALATFTGRSVGVPYQFYRLLKGTERIHMLARHLRVNVRVMMRLLRVSMTGILQFAIAHASWIGLVRIISNVWRGGGGGVHDCDTDRDLLHIAVVGTEQCRGNTGGPEPGREAAGEGREVGVADRILQHGVSRCHRRLLHRVCDAGGAAVCERSCSGADCGGGLRTLSCGNMGYAYGMVMLQAFNGAGDTMTPTIVNFFGFMVLELPLAWWLAVPMQWEREGAFLSIVIAECCIAAAGIVLFRRGRWMRQKI